MQELLHLNVVLIKLKKVRKALFVNNKKLKLPAKTLWKSLNQKLICSKNRNFKRKKIVKRSWRRESVDSNLNSHVNMNNLLNNKRNVKQLQLERNRPKLKLKLIRRLMLSVGLEIMLRLNHTKMKWIKTTNIKKLSIWVAISTFIIMRGKWSKHKLKSTKTGY